MILHHQPSLTACSITAKRILDNQEAWHNERIRAFYSMSFIQHGFIHEAERYGNRYTLTRAAS